MRDAIACAGALAIIAGLLLVNPWWLLVAFGIVAVAYGLQGPEGD